MDKLKVMGFILFPKKMIFDIHLLEVTFQAGHFFCFACPAFSAHPVHSAVMVRYKDQNEYCEKLSKTFRNLEEQLIKGQITRRSG